MVTPSQILDPSADPPEMVPSVLPPEAQSVRFERRSDSQPATVDLLDQTLLPEQLRRLRCTTLAQLHDAIYRLVVRGAPAIGVSAAYGMLLTEVVPNAGPEQVRQAYRETAEYLATSRPTAVNLFWALDRMRRVVDGCRDEVIDTLEDRLYAEAVTIDQEDRRQCQSIGRMGAGPLQEVLQQRTGRILTHCNAGALATSTLGTALAPIYELHGRGVDVSVFADETRPLLQGGRLTAWELSQAGVPVAVCTDSMAGSLMRAGEVAAVIVGADRISASGDVANKIGTYPLAVLAQFHGLPFYVAAPTNTFDLKLLSGDDIPIEQRRREEISMPGGGQGRCTVPDDADVVNPAFDVTPHELITAIITEHGVIADPDAEAVRQHFADAKV